MLPYVALTQYRSLNVKNEYKFKCHGDGCHGPDGSRGPGSAAAGTVPVRRADAARLDPARGDRGVPGGRHDVAGDREHAPCPEGDAVPAVLRRRPRHHGETGPVEG